jgi:hypothetical protein
MIRAHTLLSAALVAAVTTLTMAADPSSPVGNKADKTQVVPSRSDLQPGAAPTLSNMDDNAQRQHDPNSAAGTAKPAGATPAPGAGEVRDWSAIDKNKDNLISPEEMEAYLMQTRSPAAPRS